MAVEILIGDALEQLREMPDESVHCCVTSPPYWGLRDYGVDGQIGLEETPDEWCARLVEVFREVKRVLRADGTCWVNVGDSYASGGSKPTDEQKARKSFLNGQGGGGANLTAWTSRDQGTRQTAVGGLKPKDLIGQPWLLAFALRADGWFLRDAIVWNKPNPMPESVKDRCTNAYEHVFLLAKNKRYFFDAEAIRESDSGFRAGNGFTGRPGPGYRNAHTVDEAWSPGTGRNSRNVWTIATEAFSGSHFAVFPTELARRCILAGTSSKGVCADCGAPWERVVDIETKWPEKRGGLAGNGDRRDGGAACNADRRITTTGWQPSCKCDADLAQATVLDPFGGAGTTALVADRLQRNAILIELNADYAAMARRRIDNDRGDLLDIIDQPKPEQGSLCLVP